MSQTTCDCKCKVCKKWFKAKIADRKRSWALCCSKSCAAIKRERRTGTYRELVKMGGPWTPQEIADYKWNKAEDDLCGLIDQS